ncbi:hypothetical protein JDM601_2827 [Mycolicibacter sinensis]|uniref:Uncharacterized protein n=1 Tax=Mycolicibacter sinensis (strain JDM601) TaxID=875328 RepID=F5Z050_MYCSD|nr:hypothetical protein JDM601_2827 [Mycolicibacter sinensis]
MDLADVDCTGYGARTEEVGASDTGSGVVAVESAAVSIRDIPG